MPLIASLATPDRSFVAIGKPESQVRKASHCGSINNRDHMPRSLYYWLFAPWVLFFTHMPVVVNRTFNATQQRGCNTDTGYFAMSHVIFSLPVIRI